MSDMTREEFLKEKSDAERRIRELYSGRTLPPYPDFVSIKESEKPQVIKDSPKHLSKPKNENQV